MAACSTFTLFCPHKDLKRSPPTLALRFILKKEWVTCQHALKKEQLRKGLLSICAVLTGGLSWTKLHVYLTNSMSCFMYSAFSIFDIVAYAPGWLSAVCLCRFIFKMCSMYSSDGRRSNYPLLNLLPCLFSSFIDVLFFISCWYNPC